MKASELAKVLMEHPNLEVAIKTIDDNTSVPLGETLVRIHGVKIIKVVKSHFPWFPGLFRRDDKDSIDVIELNF